MDIYLLAFNFIIADKLLGGVPTKIIEHIVINNVLALSWWSATKLVYGAGYLAMLPFSKKITQKSSNKEYSLVDAAFYNEYIIEHRDIITDEVPWSRNCNYTTHCTDNSQFYTHSGCNKNQDYSVIVSNKVITSTNSELIVPVGNLSHQLNSDWEIINKDENKIILTNNKKGEHIIITKKEVDDMIVITKE